MQLKLLVIWMLIVGNALILMCRGFFIFGLVVEDSTNRNVHADGRPELILNLTIFLHFSAL